MKVGEISKDTTTGGETITRYKSQVWTKVRFTKGHLLTKSTRHFHSMTLGNWNRMWENLKSLRFSKANKIQTRDWARLSIQLKVLNNIRVTSRHPNSINLKPWSSWIPSSSQILSTLKPNRTKMILTPSSYVWISKVNQQTIRLRKELTRFRLQTDRWRPWCSSLTIRK